MPLSQIITNYKKRRAKEKQRSSDDDDKAQEFLDADGDGEISADELQPHFDSVSMRADVLYERLKLEKDMMDMLIKLPGFFISLFCFLAAITILAPADLNSMVHKHIGDHFYLSEAYDVKDTHALFEYMEKFEVQNEYMNPTSTKYWCEKRYSDYHWDDHYLIPFFDCRSHRFAALDLSEYKWSKRAEMLSSSTASSSQPVSSAACSSSTPSSSATASTSSSAATSASSGSSRRLGGGGSGSAGNLMGTGSPTHPYPPCIDDDAGLALEEGKPLATCASFANHVCDIDLGILFCPKTCGFCAPFTYEHKVRFGKPQVTMLPVVVYQQRFEESACHGFAHNLEMQNYNPVLTLLPALDGKKNGRILTCINRDKEQHDDYALLLDCPVGTPTTHCKNGKVPITHSVPYKGHDVYARVLVEPHRDIIAMEKINWIDIQTDYVTLSTMIYTEGIEIFTSLSVHFIFDIAGNIEAEVSMISYRDLTPDVVQTFTILLLITSINAFFFTIVLFVNVVRMHGDCNYFLVGYEVVSRLTLFVYPLVLLVSWTKQIPMSYEYELLLKSFLDADGVTEYDMDDTLKKYFEVKETIYKEVSWLEQHCLASYLLLYFQFLQLIFYFSAHPRMAMLTSTLQKAALNMVHFFVLFFVLFSMLAFMAHWLLGSKLHEFGTFSGAMSSQTKMLFGEFIYAEGADTLSGNLASMYWVYALTFMVVVFFTLLNFFLAIVVDAFVDVKTQNESLKATNGFFLDVYYCMEALLQSIHYRMPAQAKLVKYLRAKLERERENALKKKSEYLSGQTEDFEPPPLVECAELLAEFPKFTKRSLAELLCRVHCISENRLFILHDDAIPSDEAKPDGDGDNGNMAEANHDDAIPSDEAKTDGDGDHGNMAEANDPPALRESGSST